MKVQSALYLGKAITYAYAQESITNGKTNMDVRNESQELPPINRIW